MSKHVVVDVVNELCREQIIAPVRHYLEDLKFDANKDTPQLSSWMINYLGVNPENEEERKVLKQSPGCHLFKQLHVYFNLDVRLTAYLF